MEQLVYWRAFDAVLFKKKEECEIYEKTHPFLDHKRIIFYSNEGKIINIPNGSVLLDNNAFRVFEPTALKLYIDYCTRVGISVPIPYEGDFPQHYYFYKNKWHCIEEETDFLNFLLRDRFKEEYETEQTHNLVEE